MPVLDPERQRAPRSALRYRPLNDPGQARPAPAISRTGRSQPDSRSTAAPATPDDLDLEEDYTPGRRTGTPVAQPASPTRPRRRVHPLWFIVLGLAATILLWTGVVQAMSWGNDKLNTLKYGSPRIFQLDAQLGNGDSSTHPSHLLTLNLHGSIIVEVFPGGDASRLKVYILPALSGPGSAQDVATLRLVDPSHTGRSDIVVSVGGMVSFLVQDPQGDFRPPTPVEQQVFLLYLQQHP